MSSKLNNERRISRATIQNGLELILGSDHPVVQSWAEDTTELRAQLDEGEEEWQPPADWLFQHKIQYNWAQHLPDQERIVLGMKIIGDVHSVDLHLAHE